MKRRTWVLGTAAAGLGAAALLRPADRGAPHAPYFRQLGAALEAAGIGVDEIACLIDFGVPVEDNLDSLRRLGRLIAEG